MHLKETVNTSCIDMLGRTVLLKHPIKKIVSLVPSQTEFLYAIGLENEIAGQTLFCIHPQDKFKNACKVGGTKKIKHALIDEIKPDIIICNKEENTSEIVKQLSEKYPVWVSDIQSVDDALLMMESLGKLFERQDATKQLTDQIKENFRTAKIYHNYDCVYLIWRKPYMAAGKDSFISHMLKKAGFNNLVTDNRYPEISESELLLLQPEVLILSSEPYPFSDKHLNELKSLLPNTKVIHANGEMFSWYGNRMLHAQNYFNELQRRLHKEKR